MVTISVVEAAVVHAVAGNNVRVLPALRVRAPRFNVADVPPLRVIEIMEAPEEAVVPAKDCTEAPVDFPVMLSVPPPIVSAFVESIKLVGVARLLKLRASVPPLMVTPPVKIFTAAPFKISVPRPALVRPALPASTVAVPLPMVAVMPEPLVMVGAGPLRVRVEAPERIYPVVLKRTSLAVTEETVTVPAVPPKILSLSVPELGQTTSTEPSHQLEVVLESQVPAPPWAPAVTVSEPSQKRLMAEAEGTAK